MIEALKSDEIVRKVGGRFRLTALIQKRIAELIDGARPLVERNGMSDLEVVIDGGGSHERGFAGNDFPMQVRGRGSRVRPQSRFSGLGGDRPGP